MNNITQLVDRYAAIWNEPNAALRRRSIVELWAEDGAHLSKSIESYGYEALEARVTDTYEKWVKGEGFIFRRLNNIDNHHNVVKFNWEMTPAGGGEAAAVGLDFLLLSDDGRIRCAYQFIVTPPPS